MAVETPAAPAQTTETPAPTVSAEFDAASKNDFAAFQEAHTQRRAGTPLPRVPGPPAKEEAQQAARAATGAPAESDAQEAEGAEGAAPAEPKLTRKQREAQQEQRTREAVDRATAALRLENEQLRARMQTPPASAPQAPAAVPDWKRYASMPGYPKLDQFDSVEEHAAAAALFVTRAQAQEQATARQHAERQHDLQVQATAFAERMRPALEDPAFVTEFQTQLPALYNAPPLSALPPGSTPTFANVAAEVAYRSDNPAAFIRHLAAHPEDVTRIGALRPDQWLPVLSRLDGRLSTPPAAPASAETPARPSPVSSAPPPPPKVGKAGGSADPKAAALARGDVATYAELDRQDTLRRRGLL